MVTLLFLFKIGFFIYVAGAILFSIIMGLFCKYFQQKNDTILLRLAKTMIVIIIMPVLIGPAVWLEAAVIGPNWIETTHLNVESTSFNPELENLKILQITDLHIEKFGQREKSLIEVVNELEPDIILMNGDFINARSGWEIALKVLRQLKARRGIYTILGNTDYYFSEEGEMRFWLEEIGITVLTKENHKIKLAAGDTNLWIVGLSDRHGNRAQNQDGAQEIQEAFRGIPENEPKILLIHDPDHVEIKEITDYKPDLILAGDTHGGQIGIPFIRNLSAYANRTKYIKGKYQYNGIPLYVNRGIGMKTLNIRFLCRPEVTVINLIHKV